MKNSYCRLGIRHRLLLISCYHTCLSQEELNILINTYIIIPNIGYRINWTLLTANSSARFEYVIWFFS